MLISGQSLHSWIEATSELVEDLVANFEDTFGYPPDENAIKRTSTKSERETFQNLSSVRTPSDLVEFYSKIEEIYLPDVKNGIFVAPARDVVAIEVTGQPNQALGAVAESVLVVGSDGGGGLFALNDSGNAMYRLHGGALVGSSYDLRSNGVEVVANGLAEFLNDVHQALLAALRKP